LKGLINLAHIDVIAVLTSEHKKNRQNKVRAFLENQKKVKTLNHQSQIPTLVENREDNFNLVVAGYPKLINIDIIKYFSGRAVNVHPSLLPDYRGSDPIRRSILNDSNRFGFTIHQLTENFDQGRILIQNLVHTSGHSITEKIVFDIGEKSILSLTRLLAKESESLNNNVPVPETQRSTLIGTRVMDTELIIDQDDTDSEVLKKVRAAGLYRSLFVRTFSGEVITLNKPNNFFTSHSTNIVLNGRKLEITWKSDGSVKIKSFSLQ
jgi:methionyl-tRNA formyltransferase